MNTLLKQLSIILCIGMLFLSCLIFAQDWDEEESENDVINSATTQITSNVNIRTTNPETSTKKPGQSDQKGRDKHTDSKTQTNEDSENEDSANRWDQSQKTATRWKQEAVQQDFDGIIPSPGIEQLDREGNRIGDVGAKIKDGTVELSDAFIIIIKLMDLCTKLAGTIAVIFLMYGGFQYMLSGFTDEKENAKNTIKYAIIGLIVTFLAWLIITVIKTQMTKAPDEYERQSTATQEF